MYRFMRDKHFNSFIEIAKVICEEMIAVLTKNHTKLKCTHGENVEFLNIKRHSMYSNQ